MSELIVNVSVKSVSSQKVQDMYHQLLTQYGDEFTILRKSEVAKIKNGGFEAVAAAIEQMRTGEVKIEPGYDGVYGTIALQKPKLLHQTNLDEVLSEVQ